MVLRRARRCWRWWFGAAVPVLLRLRRGAAASFVSRILGSVELVCPSRARRGGAGECCSWGSRPPSLLPRRRRLLLRRRGIVRYVPGDCGGVCWPPVQGCRSLRGGLEEVVVWPCSFIELDLVAVLRVVLAVAYMCGAAPRSRFGGGRPSSPASSAVEQSGGGPVACSAEDPGDQVVIFFFLWSFLLLCWGLEPTCRVLRVLVFLDVFC